MSHEFMDGFRSWSFDEAKRKAVALDDGAIAAAVDQDAAHKLMFSDVTIGMCPWSGTRCHDGGEPMPGTADGTGRFRFGPVEGGERNCLMCRHFISGPPYMLQLWLHGTSLLDRFDQTSQQLRELDRKLQESVELQLCATSDQERRIHSTQGVSLQIQIDAATSSNLLLLKCIHRVERLLNMCEQIRTTSESDSGVDLIVQETASVVELMELSEFERSVIVTASSRLFPMMHNGATEARKDAFLDRMIWDAGGCPISFQALSPEQKRFAQDALARTLMEKTSARERQALVESRVTLEDLGLMQEIDRLIPLDIGSNTLSLSSA